MDSLLLISPNLSITQTSTEASLITDYSVINNKSNNHFRRHAYNPRKGPTCQTVNLCFYVAFYKLLVSLKFLECSMLFGMQCTVQEDPNYILDSYCATR